MLGGDWGWRGKSGEREEKTWARRVILGLLGCVTPGTAFTNNMMIRMWGWRNVGGHRSSKSKTGRKYRRAAGHAARKALSSLPDVCSANHREL